MDRKCSECGSTKIEATKKMVRTSKPKGAKPTNKLISYGRVYYECVCECGHKWEEESHL